MPKNTKKSYPLRIDQPLYDCIERLAATELRSINAEMELLLREALSRRGIKLPKPQRRKRGRPPVNDDQ